MSDPVQGREFHDAITRLSEQIREGNETSDEILIEAKRTNGRVYALERGHDVLGTRLASLTQRVDDLDPLTKRDLYVALGVLTVVGGFFSWFLKAVQ